MLLFSSKVSATLANRMSARIAQALKENLLLSPTPQVVTGERLVASRSPYSLAQGKIISMG